MSVTCHRQDLPLTLDLGWHLASPSNSLTSALKIAEVTATCNSASDFLWRAGDSNSDSYACTASILIH